MKTAISIDATLLDQADRAAAELGLTRSRLLANALNAFLRQREEAKITDQLNCAHANGPTAEEKKLIKGMKRRFSRSLADKW